MNRVRLAFFLSALMVSTAHALPNDKDQPIQIEADRLQVDETRNISEYLGNVQMSQGSLKFVADRMLLQFDANDELLWIDIEGKPARFNQLNDDGKPVSGSAARMKYLEDRSRLELNGSARFTSEKDSIESETMIINTDTKALEAGNATSGDRVRMLIQPKNSN